MGLFSSKTSYLGIDIGSSSIKIVELENYNGRPRLVTYGFSERKISELGSGDLVSKPEEAAAVVKDITEKSKTFSKKAITALPNFSVFTSILNLPYLSKKELSSAVTWEAKKLIPTPLEDIILDWKIVEKIELKGEAAAENSANNNFNNGNGGDNGFKNETSQQAMAFKKIFSKPRENLKILLTGASKNLVKKYIDIFTRAGLNLLSLETESFALIRSLIGNDKSIIALIDLGATTSNITIVEKGIPVLSRSIDLGGYAITQAISSSLNVNLERAEQFKQDIMMDAETAENSLPQTVEKSFASILNEIKYTITLFQEQSNKKVEKVILTGGTSLLGHLASYLSNVLNINTYVGDPWARVIYPTELKPILDRLGSKFSVAIGLAMRDIE